MPFVILTATSFAPVSWGWFNTWALASENNVPYKDFFIPFPMLGVWLHGSLPNLFGEMMLVESILAGLLWLGLVVGEYLLISLLLPKKFAAVGTIFAAFFYFALPTNKLAGYYESMLLFLVYGAYLFLVALKAPKWCNALYFLSGTCLTLSPFIKQTALIPSLSIIGFGLFQLRNTEKGRLKSVLFLSGCSLPVLIITFIAVKNSYFNPMIKAMLTGGGKNPGLVRSLNWGFSGAVTAAAWWPWILLFGWLFVMNLKRHTELYFESSFKIISIIVLTFTTLGVFVPQAIYSAVSPDGVTSFVIGFVATFSLVSVALVLQNNKGGDRTKLEDFAQSMINFSIIFIVFLPVLGFSSPSSIRELVISNAPGVANSLGLGGFFFTLFLFIYYFFSRQVHPSNTQNMVMFVYRNQAGKCLSVLLLSVAIANSMVAGFTAEAWHMSVGLLVAFISWVFYSHVGRKISALLMVGLLVPFFCLFSIRIVAEPYSWWALRNEPLQSSRFSIPDSPSFSGFRVNSYERTIWLRLKAAVQDDKQSEIFAGPNIGGVPLLLERKPSFNNCPVIWWDVCPENLALEDFTWLKSARPVYIFWNFQPSFVIDGHEQAFRGGEKSAISMMQDWIIEQTETGSYEVIDRIPNFLDAGDDNEIFILKRMKPN